MATGGLRTLSLHLTSDYRFNDCQPYLKFSLQRQHWTANKTTIKEWRTILLVECVYAPYRETNSPLTFIPSLQCEAQTCHVLCYQRLQRIGLLVAVALRHPTAIMVQCMRVNATFLWCVQLKQKTIVFVTQTWCVCSIGAFIEAFFPIPIPNRYWWYRPIPSTRCQYRSHPSNNVMVNQWISSLCFL